MCSRILNKQQFTTREGAQKTSCMSQCCYIGWMGRGGGTHVDDGNIGEETRLSSLSERESFEAEFKSKKDNATTTTTYDMYIILCTVLIKTHTIVMSTRNNTTKIMENIRVSNNNVAANMQAAAGEKKKKRRSKKQKSTRPKLKPVDTLPAVDEEDLESGGLGYGDIMVVPPPTPRDKLQSDLHRLEKDINALPKFTPEWFKVKADLALVQIKLDEFDNNTPTAAKMATPVLTNNTAYQDFINFIGSEEESKQQSTSSSKKEDQQQPLQQIQNKKKRSSSRKIRPKLKPQSIEKEEEGDEEDGLGFNDILLRKKEYKPSVVDEQTLLLDQVADATAQDCQEVVSESNVEGWLLRGVIVIGTLFCVLAFKFLLP